MVNKPKKTASPISAFEKVMRGLVGTPQDEVAAEQKKYETRKTAKRKPKS